MVSKRRRLRRCRGHGMPPGGILRPYCLRASPGGPFHKLPYRLLHQPSHRFLPSVIVFIFFLFVVVWGGGRQRYHTSASTAMANELKWKGVPAKTEPYGSVARWARSFLFYFNMILRVKFQAFPENSLGRTKCQGFSGPGMTIFFISSTFQEFQAAYNPCYSCVCVNLDEKKKIVTDDCWISEGGILFVTLTAAQRACLRRRNICLSRYANHTRSIHSTARILRNLKQSNNLSVNIWVYQHCLWN